jgi:prolyl-tRNA synthetase
MKYSQLFAKTLKQAPKEADTINHKFLTQAGFVDQLMAGVYSYLPLGLRVLRKVENIVRVEMDALGSQEILMPILHPKENWVTTGGWDKVDVLFKLRSRTDKEYALGQSEEEIVTPLVMSRIQTYKDLPVSVYQIHWKFRDELRAKSGILRGREFYMKDMYSFHETQEDFENYYATVKTHYLKIYSQLGLVAKVTEGSGGSFSEKISYEFMVLTDAGEDDILYCHSCDFCVNVEVAGEIKLGDKCHRCGNGDLAQAKASEVGNVFDLGQKFSKDFSLSFADKNGDKKFPIMGCYGLGISRVMGVIVEALHDEKGIIWPEVVAPFQVHLVGLDLEDKVVGKEVERIYQLLLAEGVEVLYDDRVETRAGEKFADADLIGIPQRVVISRKTLSQAKLEVKKRSESLTEFLSFNELLKRLK